MIKTDKSKYNLILNKTSTYYIERSASNSFHLMLKAGKKLANDLGVSRPERYALTYNECIETSRSCAIAQQERCKKKLKKLFF